MSDSKENKIKGFFTRLFGGSSAPEEPKKEEISTEDTREIPTKSALNKMKKADIVAVAKENGLELDINLTKAKLLDKKLLILARNIYGKEPASFATARIKYCLKLLKKIPNEIMKSSIKLDKIEKKQLKNSIKNFIF